MFISFEGGDGSGKTTQIALLARLLETRGQDVLLTREPGGTPIGERIRQVLLDPDCGEMSPVTEMLLYAAARAQLAREVVMPALATGKTVITDRWLDSSLVYQGVARGLGRAVAEVNRHATGGLLPDITFLLDIDPETGLERARGSKAVPRKNSSLPDAPGRDRIEAEGVLWHRTVREGFLSLARKHPERFAVIDAAGTPEEVHRRIVRQYERRAAGPEGEGTHGDSGGKNG